MEKRFKLALSGALLLGLPLVGVSAYAAKPVDLQHQPLSVLQSLISFDQNGANIKEFKRTVDFNNTLHVRVQQYYGAYPVMGADAVVHMPNGAKAAKSLAGVLSAAKSSKSSMNGIIYQDLNADLAGAPALIYDAAQAQKALQSAVDTHLGKMGNKNVQNKQSKLIVYVDASNKAHWAYQVSFNVDRAQKGALPEKPVYVVDAISFRVYQKWDEIKTIETETPVDGGGFGGNIKMGKLIYDGQTDHLFKLNVTRDDAAKTCSLKNTDVTVKDYNSGNVISYACDTVSSNHNGLYWDGELGAVNDGYSPENDALFGGAVIKDMYSQWYKVPVLTEDDGKPMMLNMVVHDYMDNAYWDGRQMTFGDGIDMFYPLTSLGVAAHEISHGFTEQHSNLAYYGQSGGMNEAFSDMAAQAAEVFAYGKNSWQIGPEIFKQKDRALRYMDQPSKDCHGKNPGNWCSIDQVSQYYQGLDVHFSSGIYNRVFYLMGTAEGWDVKKAFDVMVQANSNYWTSNTNFAKGACGVLAATKDLGYDDTAVKKAFEVVGVDYSGC